MQDDATASSPFPWPPVIYLAALAASFLLHQAVSITPGLMSRGLPGYLFSAAGLGCVVFGGMLLWSATLGFRRAGTPIPPNRPTKSLVTTGIYARTRNPMYLAFTLILLGLGFLTANLWMVLATIGAVVLVTRLAILREEPYLAARFGAEYEAYRAAVPRWFRLF